LTSGSVFRQTACNLPSATTLGVPWLSQQSKRFQKRIADAQNFFKHGHKWLKGEVRYPVIYGEMLMFDSLVCYGMLFDPRTTPAVLRLYGVRFGLENAETIGRDLAWHFIEREIIEYLAPLSRQELSAASLFLESVTRPFERLAFIQESPPEQRQAVSESAPTPIDFI
ncbi:MAG TPA: hypothetical protein VFQ78_15430, partial [Candidatus Udaeobacter sp.]|nr:hypothetical protein [Candidatus Udaeobacter sp.]